jgi:hypothetical protein
LPVLDRAIDSTILSYLATNVRVAVHSSLSLSPYLHSVGKEAKPKGVCPALRDALWEVHDLSFLRLDNLRET